MSLETREDTLQEILSLEGKNFLFECSTGYGKSRMAIEKVKQNYDGPAKDQILIVIHRKVHIKNWEDELKKWWPEGGYHIGFVTYMSFPKMEYSQIAKYKWIIFDECFRGDVEILTDKGFKRFDTLTENDIVAQYTDEGFIEFVKPIRLIKNQYSGDLCKLTLGRGRSCYMTPGHNQVYKRKGSNNWKVGEVKDLKVGHYGTVIPVSGFNFNGDGTHLTPMEKLLIAVQADGTLQRHQQNESVYSIQVTKGRKKARLLSILQETQNFTEIKGREEVDRYMVKLPKGDAKLLSTHFNINMAGTRALEFISEVVQWDGSLSMGNTWYYSSKIKENADFVAAVGVQAGFKVLQSVEEDNRKDSYSTIHRVYMRPDTNEVSTQPMKKEYIPYEGYVYCVEVPSHKIVVRSEGYTFISGNCHHLSQRCLDAIDNYSFEGAILLSATVSKNLKYELKRHFRDLKVKTVKLREAIDNEVLPDPKVYLLPLELNNNLRHYEIILNPKCGNPTICNYEGRWQYMKVKDRKVIIKCTQQQFISYLNGRIEWHKNKYMATRSEILKNKWLRLCGDRLKVLSDYKTDLVKRILYNLRDRRVLTFCNGIDQTIELGLGGNHINSKNKDSDFVLDLFNKGKISQITACNMLNEGMNLVDCEIGIYANLNSSETIVAQRAGRLLRHPKPIIIIPYYKNTREEELVKKMLENYNPELVKTITDIREIE